MLEVWLLWREIRDIFTPFIAENSRFVHITFLGDFQAFSHHIFGEFQACSHHIFWGIPGMFTFIFGEFQACSHHIFWGIPGMFTSHFWGIPGCLFTPHFWGIPGMFTSHFWGNSRHVHITFLGNSRHVHITFLGEFQACSHHISGGIPGLFTLHFWGIPGLFTSHFWGNSRHVHITFSSITLHYITSFHMPVTLTVTMGHQQSHLCSPNACLKRWVPGDWMEGEIYALHSTSSFFTNHTPFAHMWTRMFMSGDHRCFHRSISRTGIYYGCFLQVLRP